MLTSQELPAGTARPDVMIRYCLEAKAPPCKPCDGPRKVSRINEEEVEDRELGSDMTGEYWCHADQTIRREVQIDLSSMILGK